MKIAFDRDRYGSSARGSLVADFVEACAWKYKRFQFDDMESLLRRLGRTRAQDAFVYGPSTGEFDDETQDELPVGPTATDVLEEESDQSQNYVIKLLQERQSALEDRYPFNVDGVAVTWRELEDTAYDSLLAITLAHAFSITCSPTLAAKSVEVLFEHVTARCLRNSIFRVHNFGEAGRQAGTFGKAMEQASKALDWQLSATAMPHKRSAQEDGCDTLVMIPWRDRRPGRVFFVGQATLTTSDRWPAKIAEPAPGVWGRRLQLDGMPPPIPFLAVSHHVEKGPLRDLQARSQGMVIDRLRLACGEHAATLSVDEKRVIHTVRGAQIEV